MANKTNKTETKSELSSSAARIAEIRAKQEAMRLELANLAKEAETVKEEMSEEISQKIATLPALFGVADVEAVFALLREHRQGLASGKAGRKTQIPAATKEACVAAMKAAKAPGATPQEVTDGQPSNLATKYGISTGTINIWKKEAGLTRSYSTAA